MTFESLYFAAKLRQKSENNTSTMYHILFVMYLFLYLYITSLGILGIYCYICEKLSSEM